MLTAYQAQAIVWELTRRKGDTLSRIAETLADIPADLNPHQIDAAVFALRSPFIKGVILADEVGLGKSVETGIVLAQLFAEGHKRFLIVCSGHLLDQWSTQLQEHFLLPCRILHERLFEDSLPEAFDGATLVSCTVCSKYAEKLAQVPWNRVVFDDAFLLKNLYRNDRKTGSTLLPAFDSFCKIIITATPIQNSPMELWSLLRFIDETAFPDPDVFYERYVVSHEPENQEELQQRLKPYLHRTLRRQVLPFVHYPARRSVTISYRPDKKQEKLLAAITRYFFGKTKRFSVPLESKGAFAVFLKKAAASSLAALVGTLETFRGRIQTEMAKATPETLSDIKQEAEEIENFIAEAGTIHNDPKLDGLIAGLHNGLAELEKTGAKRKAVIFTSSLRTQQYLAQKLEENGYSGKVVTFNGQNKKTASRRICRKWKTQNAADIKHEISVSAALIAEFANEAEILIATDIAATGFDLQFCSMVVNYDLPWNPLLLESRIGRCHRYGQKHEVVVVNFLDESNPTDLKLFSLYKEKLKLFDGVFNASDDVFGSLESGKNIEREITKIVKTCQTTEAIEKGFQRLQNEFADTVKSQRSATKTTLFEQFDEEVRSRFQLHLENTKLILNETTDLFWRLLKYYFQETHEFNDENYTFRSTGLLKQSYYLTFQPPPKTDLTVFISPKERRRRFAETNEIHPFRFSGYEAQTIFDKIRNLELPPIHLVFTRRSGDVFLGGGPDGRGDHPEDAGWKPAVPGVPGGHLQVDLLAIHGFETTEHLVYTMCDETGKELPAAEARKLLLYGTVVAEEVFRPFADEGGFKVLVQKNIDLSRLAVKAKSETFFEEESARLEYWADTLNDGLTLDIRKITGQIEELDRQMARQSNLTLEQKLEYQQRKSSLEKLRNAKRRSLFDEQDKIEARREAMISSLKVQMDNPKTEIRPVLQISWDII